MDRLDAMAAFVAVADLQGFAAAARRLNRSPSAVTRLIASLEERLSTRLLQRTTRSVTLTDAGARYLERARGILAALAQAETLAQADHTAPTGRLAVTAPLVFGRLHVAPLMCRYLERYPAVRGDLTLADRAMSLVEESIDLAVRIGTLEDSGLIARKVGETRRVLVAAPAYLRGKRLQTPGDLKRHAVIQFTALQTDATWHFTRAGRGYPVALSPSFVTNSADAALGHAQRGGGLTLALSYQVADAVRSGGLEIALERYEPPALPIHLVYPSGRLLSAKVRAFIELVTTTCHWQFTELEASPRASRRG